MANAPQSRPQFVEVEAQCRDMAEAARRGSLGAGAPFSCYDRSDSGRLQKHPTF